MFGLGSSPSFDVISERLNFGVLFWEYYTGGNNKIIIESKKNHGNMYIFFRIPFNFFPEIISYMGLLEEEPAPMPFDSKV